MPTRAKDLVTDSTELELTESILLARLSEIDFSENIQLSDETFEDDKTLSETRELDSREEAEELLKEQSKSEILVQKNTYKYNISAVVNSDIIFPKPGLPFK